MSLKVIWVVALLATYAQAVLASTDLANCRHANGAPIEHKVCDSLRAAAAREKEQASRQEARLAKIREAEAQRQASEAEQESQRAAGLVEAQKRAAVERLQREQLARQERDRQTEAEAAEEARLQAAQAVCGRDFRRPSMGMPLERARLCLEDLRLHGEAGGFAYYLAGPAVLQVQRGVVVGWLSK
jgi:hypothetical protein